MQERLDAHAGGMRRWTATVTDGVVRIDGAFDDHTERRIVDTLVRAVPGVGSVAEVVR